MSISWAESVPIALAGVIFVYIGCAITGCLVDILLMIRRIENARTTRVTPSAPVRSSVRQPASLGTEPIDYGPIDYDPIRLLRTQAPHPPPTKFRRLPPLAPIPTHYVQRESYEGSLCASICPIDTMSLIGSNQLTLPQPTGEPTSQPSTVPQPTGEPTSQPSTVPDTNMCSICLGKVANVVTVPCLHAVMCDVCTGYIRANFAPNYEHPFAPCPICRMGMRSYWLVVGEWTPGPTPGSQVARTRKLQRYRYHSRMFMDAQVARVS